MRHLVDGLIVEPADAGVARDCLVVQYVAAVSDGVDRDGSDEALFNGEARCAACREYVVPSNGTFTSSTQK